MNISDRVRLGLDLAKLAAIVAAILLSLFSALLVGSWTLWGHHVIDFARAELSLPYGDRILQSRPGFSYAIEPVSKSDPDVKAIFHLRRTKLGMQCDPVSVIPIFEGPRNVALPGVMKTELVQPGLEFGAVGVKVSLPVDLEPGRVGLRLVVEYTCGGHSISDETAAVFFILKPLAL